MKARNIPHKLTGTKRYGRDAKPNHTRVENYYVGIDPGVSNQFLSKIDWYIRKRLAIFWTPENVVCC